jgi:hypothetical protein
MFIVINNMPPDDISRVHYSKYAYFNSQLGRIEDGDGITQAEEFGA